MDFVVATAIWIAVGGCVGWVAQRRVARFHGPDRTTAPRPRGSVDAAEARLRGLTKKLPVSIQRLSDHAFWPAFRALWRSRHGDEAPVRDDDVAALGSELKSGFEQYGRWIGPDSTRDNHLAGLARVPAELLEHVERPELDALRTWLGSPGSAELRPTRELVSHFASSDITDEKKSVVPDLLRRLGVGMEPDPSRGGASLRDVSGVALFELPAGDHPPSDAYRLGLATAHMVAHVVTAASGPGDAETSRWRELLDGLDLSPAERRRVESYYAWALGERVAPDALGRSLRRVARDHADEIADAVVRIAAADVVATPAERDAVKDVFEALNLDVLQANRAVSKALQSPDHLDPKLIEKSHIETEEFAATLREDGFHDSETSDDVSAPRLADRYRALLAHLLEHEEIETARIEPEFGVDAEGLIQAVHAVAPIGTVGSDGQYVFVNDTEVVRSLLESGPASAGTSSPR